MDREIPEQLLKKLHDLSGLRILPADTDRLLNWIDERLKALGLDNLNDYFIYISNQSNTVEECERLSALLTTGETFFMRDPGQMSLISRVILPELVKRKSLEKTIRIWAPCCATGEEIYSLVILLEAVLPESAGWHIDLIGSDINPLFLSRAKAAVYGDWSFRGCDDAFKKANFDLTSLGWKLKESVRSKVRFLVLDLVNSKLPDVDQRLFDVDFILCRNLFIYMSEEAISKATDKLVSCLARDGLLMTAHGELNSYRKNGLQVRVFPESLVYQKIDFAVPSLPLPALVSDISLANVDDLDMHPISSVALLTDTKTKRPERSIQDKKKEAWRLADRGQLTESFKLSVDLLQKDSMDASLQYLHAVLCNELAMFPEAREGLRKALYLDHEFVPAYLELVMLNIKDGKKEQAKTLCNQALEILKKSDDELKLTYFSHSSVADLEGYLTTLRDSLT